MLHLVIGHTSSDSAWIWVRGRRAGRACVEIRNLNDDLVAERELRLRAARDYIGVARFDGELEANTPYRVVARLGRERKPFEGHLRTFPLPKKPEGDQAFTFFHGSCNLSTARLTALGSAAVGLVGGVAAQRALGRDLRDWETPWKILRPLWVRGLARWVLQRSSQLTTGGVMATTRFALPQPQLPSPFAELAKSIEETIPEQRPAFMIHAGDQIYFDVDFPARKPTRDAYRRSYRQAWFEDEHVVRLLAGLPHYMILDDHEILDGYGTDPDDVEREHEEPALGAYHEYVGCRQPGDAERRHYTFEHGCTRFFVLDTRTHRSPESRRMIDEVQMEELENWLGDDPGGLKFVISSVPFAAQLRAPGLAADGTRREDEQSDKWSGRAWRPQRERILAAIYEKGVERLVFLVGDMHCAYHATLRIGSPARRLTVHELAGGPIHQLLFARRGDFHARYSDTFRVRSGKADERELPWTSTLEAFHGAAPSVLRISVSPAQEREPLQLDWKVELTRTKAQSRVTEDPASLCGRIRFPRHARELE